MRKSVAKVGKLSAPRHQQRRHPPATEHKRRKRAGPAGRPCSSDSNRAKPRPLRERDSKALLLVLTPIANTNEPFRGVRRPPKGQREAERSKDDQGRNDRVVQIGPDGRAASSSVMGCPQDRAPDRD